MKRKIFTMITALCGLLVANAENVSDYAGLKQALNDGKTEINIAVGTYVLEDGELNIPAGTTVTGGWKADFSERIYPGTATTKEEMTILDGNSLLTVPASKHRVAVVSGTLEGVVVRNGHVRDGNGGGLLIEDNGTVQNCIIKGNVAMNLTTNDALGGGAYLNGADAKLINSVVAFNMANNGYGVAGAGQVINNTITANTYAPVAVEVVGATYKHFKHWRIDNTLWGDNAMNPVTDPVFDASKHLDDKTITVDNFYLSQTTVTTSQYAVFAAAVDLAVTKDLGSKNVHFATTRFSELTDPSTGEAVTTRMGFESATPSAQYLFRENSFSIWGLKPSGGDYIYVTIECANQPMTYVSWFGSLAYSVWIGGSLPTEGQWELAARSNGTSTPETFLYAGTDVLNDVAWYREQGNELKEVALLASNQAGLYDMTGNVSEWCADWINSTSNAITGIYYPDYTDVKNHHRSMTNPLWSSRAIINNRVLRGGNYSMLASGRLSIAYRADSGPLLTSNSTGFRIVLVP